MARTFWQGWCVEVTDVASWSARTGLNYYVDSYASEILLAVTFEAEVSSALPLPFSGESSEMSKSDNSVYASFPSILTATGEPSADMAPTEDGATEIVSTDCATMFTWVCVGISPVPIAM